MKYVLFVFARNTNQDEFAKILSNEISSIATSKNIKYYYSSEVIIFTFESTDEFVYVNEFFNAILGALWIPYFITPFETDKMSYWMERNAEKHLFGTDKCIQPEDYFNEEKIEVLKLMINTDEFLEKSISDTDDVDRLFDKLSGVNTSKQKKINQSLDDILDKINLSGIDSLTDDEEKILNSFSNNYEQKFKSKSR